MGNYTKILMIYCEFKEYLDKILSNIAGWEYKVEEWLASFSLNNLEQDRHVSFTSKREMHNILLVSHIKDKYKGGDIYDITYEDDGKCKMMAYDKLLNELCTEVNRTIERCRDNGEVLGETYCAVCPSQFRSICISVLTLA